MLGGSDGENDRPHRRKTSPTRRIRKINPGESARIDELMGERKERIKLGDSDGEKDRSRREAKMLGGSDGENDRLHRRKTSPTRRIRKITPGESARIDELMGERQEKTGIRITSGGSDGGPDGGNDRPSRRRIWPISMKSTPSP